MDSRSLMQQYCWLAGFVSVDGCLDLVGLSGASGFDGKAGDATIWCVWAFIIRSITHLVVNISWLEEYGHPVVVAVEVGMIVRNPLVNNVYTTHPVVVVIDE
eukprot:11965348-Ditylum_brightwellii.AAC.1